MSIAAFLQFYQRDIVNRLPVFAFQVRSHLVPGLPHVLNRVLGRAFAWIQGQGEATLQLAFAGFLDYGSSKCPGSFRTALFTAPAFAAQASYMHKPLAFDFQSALY